MQELMLAGKRCQAMRAWVERHDGSGLKRDGGARDAQAGGPFVHRFPEECRASKLKQTNNTSS